MVDVVADFVLKGSVLTNAEIIKLMLLGALLSLFALFFVVTRYISKEIKSLKEELKINKIELSSLKKDVDACHAERRKLQLRSDRQQRSIDDNEVQNHLLSSLILEMRNKADG